MALVGERFSGAIGPHPEKFVVEFNLHAPTDDLRIDKEAVFLEVFFFFARVANLHRSSNPQTRLENEATLLAAFPNDGLLWSLPRFDAAAGKIKRNRGANDREQTGVIAHERIRARPTPINDAGNPGSENGVVGQGEK